MILVTDSMYSVWLTDSISDSFCLEPYVVWHFSAEAMPVSSVAVFMKLARLCTRFPGADDGIQPQCGVHIFMDRCLAVTPAFQIDRHATVPIYSIIAMVDLFNLLPGLCFLGVITNPTFRCFW